MKRRFKNNKNLRKRIAALVLTGAITLGIGAVYRVVKDYIPDPSIVDNHERQYFTFEELANAYREIEAKAQDVSSLSDESLLSLANEWKKLYASCRKIEKLHEDENFLNKYQYFNMPKMKEIEEELCQEFEKRHLLLTPQNDYYISMQRYYFGSREIALYPVDKNRSIEYTFIKGYMKYTDEVKLQDLYLIYDTCSHYYYLLQKRDNEIIVKPCAVLRANNNEVDRVIFGISERKHFRESHNVEEIFQLSSPVTGNDNKTPRAYFQNLDMSDYIANDLWLYYIDIEREYEIVDDISNEELIDLCRKWVNLKKNYQRLRKATSTTECDNNYYLQDLDSQMHIATGEFQEIGNGLRAQLEERGLISDKANKILELTDTEKGKDNSLEEER